MENLEELNVNTDNISFESITNIDIIMKNGIKIRLATPLRADDFLKIWNTKKRKVKIITGNDSFACINKRYAVFYHIYPIAQ